MAVAGRRRDALKRTAAGYPADRVHVIAADLAEVDAPAQAAADTTARFGRLDVVVASAGTSGPRVIEDLDPEFGNGSAASTSTRS